MSIQISSIKSEISDASYNGKQAYNSKSVTNIQKGRSSLWNFFTKWDHDFAICNFCQNKFSYKTSTANLKKHLYRKHDAIVHKLSPSFTVKKRSIEKDYNGDKSINKILIQETFEIIDSNFDKLQSRKKRKLAYFSNLFDVLEGSIACCKVCNDELSFKSTTSNLMEHYKEKHPTFSTNPDYINLNILELENQSRDDKVSSSDEKSSEVQESNMDYQEINLEPEIPKVEILTTDNLHFVNEHSRKERVELSKGIENEKVLNVTDEEAKNNTKSSETSQSPSAIYQKTLDGKKKKWSWVWNYFTEVDKNFALCNICNQVFNYKTTISNLAKHKTRMHPDVSLNLKEAQESEKNESVYKEESRKIGLVDKRFPNIGEIRSVGKSAYERSSYIWRFFKKVNDTLAECNFCKIKLSYKNSVTNLMIHRKREHPAIHVKSNSTKRESVQNVVDGTFANENQSEDDLNDEKSSETVAKRKGGRKKSSSAWDFFTMLDKHFAQCKICEEKFSLKSTVSNLVRHIRRKHSSVTVVQDSVKSELDDVAVNEDNSLHNHSRDQSKISDSEDGEEESPNEIVADTKKKNCRRTSVVWDFFTFIDKNYAQCKICKIIFSHKTTLSNLRRHYKRKHHIEALRRNPGNQMKIEKNEFDKISVNEDCSSPTNFDQPKIWESNGEESEIECVNERSHIIEKYSPSWKFFNFIDNSEVQCKVCGLIFSRQTTLLNLHQHFKKRHPDLTMEFNSDSKQLPIRIMKTIHSFNQHQASNMCDEQPAYVLPDIRATESESTSVSFLSTHTSQNNNESHIPDTSQADSQNRTTNNLSERLVNAVEESNQLLKNMQKTMEKQGEILNKLVTCLEDMKYKIST